MRAMLDIRHQFGLYGRIGLQLVGHPNVLSGPLAPEQLAHQPQSCSLVSSALHQRIKDVAVGIDGTPQPVFLSVDRQ